MVIVVGFFMVLFVIVCVLLTVIILMQDTKGEGLSSGIFGGMGAESLLGGRGVATFLSKLTTYLAIGYILLALILARFYGTSSVKIPTKPETEVSQTATEDESAEGDTIQITPEDVEESTEDATNEEK